MQLFRFIVLAALAVGGWGASPVGAREFQIAPGDSLPADLQPGDICWLRGGTYRSEHVAKQLKGTSDHPIVLAAYPGEAVVFDGSDPIDLPWRPHKKGLFKAPLEEAGWQLFFNGRMMTTARFPNASWEDGSIWDLTASCRHVAEGSRPGVTVDARPPKGSKKSDEYDEGHVERALTDDSVNAVSLAASGVDYTGATAILHIGSWLSWAQEIKTHKKGSDTFTYSADFERSGNMRRGGGIFKSRPEFFHQKNIKHGEGYYFIEGLQCLDAPGEWFYTPQDKMLYLMPPTDPKKPIEIKIKRRTYGLTLEDCEHVIVRGIDFFASTFRLKDCRSVVVEDCSAMYPSYNKIVLGDFRRPEVTGIYGGSSAGNVIRNCRFEKMDGPGIEIEGTGNVIENCLFAEIDYTNLGTGGEGTLNAIRAPKTVFRRNTIHTTGNSEGIRCGPQNLVELNHVYNMSLIQHDGSQINVGVSQQAGTILRQNWSHDSLKASLRFDSSNMGDPATVNYGTDGSMIRNVMWNSGPMKIKGERHTIIGNTGFDGTAGPCIAVLDNPSMGGFNLESVTVNNFGALSGHFSRIKPVPGKAENNIQLDPGQDAANYLRDPKNRDFRPKAGSPLIDAGQVVEGMEYVGQAPDIGAYEFGADQYWIPGRQEPQASMPVPPAGARKVKPDADLMWLPAYRSTFSAVFFGTSPRHLRPIAKFENNIFTPPVLRPGKTYYWRVDSLLENGERTEGPIWSFTVGK